MNFSTLQTRILNRLGKTSTADSDRIGNEINEKYREITSSVGLNISRQTTVTATATVDSSQVTLSGIERIDRVWILDSEANRTVLDEVTLAELRAETPEGSDSPTRYAILSTTSSTVTILLDTVALTTFTLTADGVVTVADLSGSDTPAFPESYHDVIVYGVLYEEYMRMEKPSLAQIELARYNQRLSNLRMFIAKSISKDIQQGRLAPGTTPVLSGSGGSGGANIGQTDYTQTGLITFDRDPSAPFAVTASSAKVANLDADKLDGLDSTAFVQVPGTATTDNAVTRFNGTAGQIQNSGVTIDDSNNVSGAAAISAASVATTGNVAATGTVTGSNVSGSTSGTNTGDVTLAGTPTYITIAGQVITRNQIDLTTDVTGDLPFSNVAQSSAASKLLGRGSAAGAGDFQEITLGTNLSMSGTALDVANPVTNLALTNYRETKSAPSISANTLTLDLANGNHFAVSLNANITTLTFSNVPASGKAAMVVILFTADGTARTITWPASVKWPSASSPTMTSTLNKVDIITLYTVDGGTTWYGVTSGQNF